MLNQALQNEIPNIAYATIPVIKPGETVLKVVDEFCYLSSVLSSDAGIDDDIGNRLGKAGAAFGRLTMRVLDDHRIRFQIKIAVYRAGMLTTLLRWLRVMDTVQTSYTEARSVPSEMFEQNCQHEMTGNDSQHPCT